MEYSEEVIRMLNDIKVIVDHANKQRDVVAYADEMQREADFLRNDQITEEEFKEAVISIDKRYCDKSDGIEEAEFVEVDDAG